MTIFEISQIRGSRAKRRIRSISAISNPHLNFSNKEQHSMPSHHDKNSKHRKGINMNNLAETKPSGKDMENLSAGHLLFKTRHFPLPLLCTATSHVSHIKAISSSSSSSSMNETLKMRRHSPPRAKIKFQSCPLKHRKF